MNIEHIFDRCDGWPNEKLKQVVLAMFDNPEYVRVFQEDRVHEGYYGYQIVEEARMAEVTVKFRIPALPL